MTSEEALIKWRVAVSNVERLEKDALALKESLAILEQTLEEYTKAKYLLEVLKNYKLEKRKDFILGIINSALRDIFEADYRLDIQPRETKGKSVASTQKYDIIFFQNGIEIARNNDLLTSNGGGVLSVASLFFKILIGYLYSKNKFYIFDEALSQVSPQYRERLSLFLKEFCNKYNFTLVVVSQTEELETHADLVYEVDSDINNKGIPVLNIVDVIGEEPQEDYYYVKIKNFQSIVDQTFIFKGFTIIRGPNNSGKSASLRAIESVIFNNFNTNLYPRKNPDGKKLTTEIYFGHKGAYNEAPKEIGLKYKSNKVMFLIQGEEYYGKNLAADKLKEEVEKIGFKYIDLKQMYKNFKGDLKEQTERIAYTNQYDGLFLIGAKTSDSEKIFSFLFNTENIALAIARAKETMQEISKEHKEKQIQLADIEEDLIQKKKYVELYNKVYYYMLVNEYTSISTEKEFLGKKEVIYIQLIEKVQLFISSVENADWLRNYTKYVLETRNKIESNTRQESILEQLIEKIQNYNAVQEALSFKKDDSLKERITRLEALIPRIQYIIQIDSFARIQDHLKTLDDSFRAIAQKEHELSQQYNLQECDCCSGLGVKPL